MKKTFLCALLVMVGLLFVTGCGKKADLKAYAGTYKLDYSKYVGDPETAKSTEEWTMVLNEDGTGKSNRDGTSYDIEWSIDGENVKVTEKFIGTIDYNGTLKDGKMDIFNGDKTNDLTLEAIFIKQ